MIKDTWEEFLPRLEYTLVATTAFKVHERYIFLLGGLNYFRYEYRIECMEKQLLMLDIDHPEPSWQAIRLKGSFFNDQRGQIGIIPLNLRDPTEFIVFGGITISSETDRSYASDVYKLSLLENSKDQFESKLTLMENVELSVNDRMYFNAYFYDDRDETHSTIVVPSREALHIFDTKAQRYMSSDAGRAYKSLIPQE